MAHVSARAAASSRAIFAPVIITAALVLGLMTAISPVGAVAVDVGYMDHSYDFTAVISTPTRDKPQSKVWYTDGFWWAGLVATPGDTFIHRYNATTHTWTNTGVAVDVRNSSQADYLWDASASALYVASAPEDASSDPIKVFKLNYDAGSNTYSHDSDFGSTGVNVGTGPAETVTIARDSTGQLWVTYTNPIDPTGVTTTDRNVMINRSTTSEDVWGTPFALADGRTGDDDISGIIAFGGNSVGVMWSDEIPVGGETAFYFATHSDAAADTTWAAKVVAAQGPGTFAEDHLNLKLAAPGSGQIIAAVKTNGGPDHIQLLRRNAGTGAWTKHLVVGSAQDATRPQVVIDASASRAYVFFGSPEDASAGDQAVYYKSAPLSSLSFTTTGLGTLFIKDAGEDVLDVSLPKHSVTNAMGGILGIASGESNRNYYHGWLPLGVAPTPTPTPTPGNPFTDISGSKFRNDIIWIWERGITAGCSPTTFCPKGLVTRAQMATFLVRALELPPTSTDFFGDDNSSIHEANINALAKAGITAGCAPGRFCPNGVVAREQMATFLARAFNLPPTSTDYFTDDESSIHEARINALRAANITGGCTPTTYCPKGAVNREQMAAFLHRALVQ